MRNPIAGQSVVHHDALSGFSDTHAQHNDDHLADHTVTKSGAEMTIPSLTKMRRYQLPLTSTLAIS